MTARPEHPVAPMTLGALRTLLDAHAPPCISLYVAPDGRGGARRESPLGSLIDDAAQLIRGNRDAARLLAPLRAIEHSGTWRIEGQAAALFRSEDLFASYAICAFVEDLVVVSGTFHTRPLIRHLTSADRFYVLVLLPWGPRLFENVQPGLREVAPGELPFELARALREWPRGSGDASAAYFRRFERALAPFLRDRVAPLVLAGNAALRARYRATSPTGVVVEEGVDLEPGAVDAARLHSCASALVRRHEAQVRGAIAARLSSALATGRAEVGIRAVARAVIDRRVDLLLFSADARLWGRVNRRTGALRTSDHQRDDEDGDVIDDLAEIVLLSGGDVHELPPAALPPNVDVAAICAAARRRRLPASVAARERDPW